MRAAAERIVSCASAAIAARGRFSWVLSGGNTPQRLYMLLGTPDYAARIGRFAGMRDLIDGRCSP